jgi:DNA replicative helicase MCM subunit Mcm2 (Cdc46/Mcm family)
LSSQLSKEIEITEELRRCGVTRLHKGESNFFIICNNRPIIFDIGKDWIKTLHPFEKAYKNNIDRKTQQAIIFCLSSSDKYQNILRYDSNYQSQDKARTEASTEEVKSLGKEEIVNEEILSVSAAKRRHFGRVMAVGMIVSISELYQLVKRAIWRCCACNKQIEKTVVKLTEPPITPKYCIYCGKYTQYQELHQYINAVTVTIQDDTAESSLDSLPVIVFEKDTQNINVGENVKVIGRMEKTQDRKSKRFHSILLAESVEYEHRKKLYSITLVRRP